MQAVEKMSTKYTYIHTLYNKYRLFKFLSCGGCTSGDRRGHVQSVLLSLLHLLSLLTHNNLLLTLLATTSLGLLLLLLLLLKEERYRISSELNKHTCTLKNK